MLAVAAIASPLSVDASGQTLWTGDARPDSQDNLVEATVIQDGTGGLSQFHYSYDACAFHPPTPAGCGGPGIPLKTLYFATTADATEDVRLDYTFTGFHAFAGVTVGLRANVISVLGSDTDIELVDDGPVSCCEPPSAGFTYSGTVHLQVEPGDTFGFTITGSNGDATSLLEGTLTVATSVVVNGSFEQGEMDQPTTFDRLGSGSTVMPGWTVVGDGNVDWTGGRWQASDGVRSLELAGSGPGEIYQDVPTIDGQRYDVRYAVSANPGRTGEPLAPDCGGAQNPTPTYGFALGSTVFTGPGNTFTLGNSAADMKWQHANLEFTATESVTRLRFFSTDPASGCGIVIDDISAVPILDTVQDPLEMTVTTADDHSDGLCGTNDCSLRDAIEWSNANPPPVDGGPNTISFNIDTSTTFDVDAPLPTITAPLSIDGSSQPASSCPVPDGLLQVHLRPGEGYEVLENDSPAGLTIAPSGLPATIRGLVIEGFPGDGISAGLDDVLSSGLTVTCNVIGTSAHPNGGAGIHLADVNNAQIGADLISGTGNLVDANLISHNNGDGIAITSSLASVGGDQFAGNVIHDNAGLGIDLGDDGVTPNDAGDADTGINGLLNVPELMRAQGGAGGYIAGHLNSAPLPNQDVTFYHADTCDPSGYGEGGDVIGTANVELDASGETTFLVSLTGLPTSGYVTATSTASGETSEFSNCIPLSGNNDSWPSATDLTGQSSTAGTINYAGQTRWYKFAVTPGSDLQIDLTDLPVDYDLLLFKDIAQAYTALSTPADLTQLTAESSGKSQQFSGKTQQFSGKSQQFSEDTFSGKSQQFSGKTQQFSGDIGFSSDTFSGANQKFSGEAFAPATQKFSEDASSGATQRFSPDAYASAQERSLVDFSDNDGLAPESMTDNTWNNTGYYYVRVSGRSGAFDPVRPFSLHLAQSGNVCAGLTPYTPGSVSGPAATGRKTIIIYDSTRIATTATEAAAIAAEKLALLDALNALEQRPEVAGKVVDVSSIPIINSLNAQAVAHAGCPYAKNLVAMAIKDVVDSYRPSNPSLAYVVLAGGDSAIPFFRYADTAGLAPESAYFPPVEPGSISDASLQLDYVLSQDAYGAGRQLSLGVDTFPVSDLAVGRLVETASEATGLLSAYPTATGGVVATPTRSLVTGYDFMADAADAVQANFVTGIGSDAGTVTDTLIAPNGALPSDPDSWDADELRGKLLNSGRHDLVFLAGHFSSSAALAADYATQVTATEIANSATDFQNTIVFSQGCHSGYNLVDEDGIDSVTDPLDWAQAFARKGATLIAGTGYQYGDTDLIAYSEAIYENFSKQLLAGSGPVAVGEALVAAKQAYLAANPKLEGIDTKALLQSALFGLPMLSVDLQHGRGTSTTPPETVVTAPVTGGTGPSLGLRAAPLTIPVGGLTQHTKDLNGINGAADVTATWYSGPDGTSTKPFEPALPVISKEVRVSAGTSVTGEVLRGVGFRGGAYSDFPGIVPLSGAPATELRTSHSAFGSPSFYPVQVATPNYFDALGGGATRLLVTPVQHRSEGLDVDTSTLRRYDNVDVSLFYSAERGAVAGTSAPAILDVSAVVGNSVDFDVHVVGDPAAGIKNVWVTYTGFDNQWRSIDLSLDPSDSTHWTGEVDVPAGHTPSEIQFVVQAVNGVGMVTLDSNDGAYYQIASTPATPPTNVTSINLDASNPSTGVFGSTVEFTATLSGATPIDGQIVLFTLDGSTRVGTTNGSQASASYQLDLVPGPHTVTAAFLGDANDLPSQDSDTINVTKAPTSLSLTGNGSGSQGADSGIVATLTSGPDALGQRTVVFTVSDPAHPANAFSRTVLTDGVGKAALGSVALPAGMYDVNAYFGTTVTLLPSSTQLDLTDDAYEGDSDHKTYEVLSGTPTFTFDVLPDVAFSLTPFSVASAVHTNSPGVVSFALGSGSVGCTVSGVGLVTTTGTATGALSCIISASLAPGGGYVGAGPITRSFHITMGDQTITFAALPSRTYGDPPFSVAASASSGLPVTFTASGKCSIAGSTVTINGAGTCTVTAAQAGNANWNAAANVARTFTIDKAAATLAFTSTAPVGAVYGDSYTPTASKGASGTPVTFAASGNCTVSSGKFTMTKSGSCTVTANQASSVNYLAGSRTQTFDVGKKGATLGYTGNLFWSAGSGTTANVTFTGKVTPASGGTISIAKATVDFLLFKTGNFTTTPDDHCLGSVNSSGVGTCTKTLGLDNWTVIMTIPGANEYFTAPNADAVALTVYQVVKGSYATGAGSIVDPSYLDLPVKVAPAPKNLGVFGFAVSYKSGTTPRGVAVYMFRGVDGYDYVFTTTGWSGGGLSFGSGTASFSAKCSVTVLDPATHKPVSGKGGTNYTCRFDVTDAATDKLAFSAWTPGGALYHQAGTVGAQIPLVSGGIIAKK